ncbi:MAG: chromosome partitioning protein ParB, partial [Pseudorhodoplanes sp.]|nr:chromosome partitioning protein ParB [Pseudorhodoplanes sp.]
AVSLDMAKWWHPTRNTYFDRVSKRKITGAISEALSPRTAQAIAALKKPAMALKAEELLKGLTWLPAPLRLGSPQ